MIASSLLRRMALAAVLTTGVGGVTTTAVPGLDHWPPSTVVVIVAAITVLGGMVRKLISAALVAVVVTVVVIVADAVTGGHIQQLLNLGGPLGLGGGTA